MGLKPFTVIFLFVTSVFSSSAHFLNIPLVINRNYNPENISVTIDFGSHYQPYSALVRCSYLPTHSIWCEPPVDLAQNSSMDNSTYGCRKWGGRKFEHVQITSIVCHALDEIECYGNRTFLRSGYPCIFFSGHYFVKTLIYSTLLGLFGVDLFCLGHIGLGVGKILTIGGLGIWWIADIIRLINGDLVPADGSSWMPYN